jgi:hypothetical protein
VLALALALALVLVPLMMETELSVRDSEDAISSRSATSEPGKVALVVAEAPIPASVDVPISDTPVAIVVLSKASLLAAQELSLLDSGSFFGDATSTRLRGGDGCGVVITAVTRGIPTFPSRG